ncbi:carbohydrate kinase [Aquirufa regiilacus]|uniref:Carbohydrate kinase n=1 Tax=Aquirufa regiilacus TaxID=3024868 RepID=A0ABU3TPG7_9BACT|nr:MULTISPECIES: carbohydrate kinase [unclassified Aquirufa]MDT8886967.1 FGGY-family carbohydrate kinase [Aquirufa sp. LEPPI-3A]MDU0807756.1 carbohydrate kinase [Aquirufa sp. LEOWEIH-7C]
MSVKTPVIAVFDIGKTNKKVFLWDTSFQIVFEKQQHFAEIVDEDGFACEDLAALQQWIVSTFTEICQMPEFELIGLNFSAYGASFVYVDRMGEPVAPLYNYLKPATVPFPYADFGGESEFARRTASPILGNLNSGLQVYAATYKLFWPEVFQALHLPNYLASLFTGRFLSEITSIGCHTALWDFDLGQYHHWVSTIEDRLAPISSVAFEEIDGIHYGLGLHDSSAALVPYLRSISEDFVLLSTGTWCIAMHPFNDSPLTSNELANDVLCYLQPNGKSVKASRLFGGHFHEEQVARLEQHFGGSYKDLKFSDEVYVLKPKASSVFECSFASRNLDDFTDLASAYDQFMVDLVGQQIFSLNLLLKDASVKQLLVDGGFSKNEWYMRLLAHAFPKLEVYAAEVAQASALGAALMVYKGEIPKNLIQLKRY